MDPVRLGGTAEKRCSRCGEVKPRSEFSVNNGKPGQSGRCKPCARLTTREWRRANPERVRATNREIARRHRACIVADRPVRRCAARDCTVEIPRNASLTKRFCSRRCRERSRPTEKKVEKYERVKRRYASDPEFRERRRASAYKSRRLGVKLVSE